MFLEIWQLGEPVSENGVLRVASHTLPGSPVSQLGQREAKVERSHLAYLPFLTDRFCFSTRATISEAGT